MFGLSKREVLESVIENACKIKLPVYESNAKEIVNLLKENSELSDSQIETFATNARRCYLNSVYDAVKDSLAISAPAINMRFNMSLMSPSITGLPPEFTIDHFAENGISAGATFIMVYYAITGKPANTARLYRTASMLSHFQNDLMNNILFKLDN